MRRYAIILVALVAGALLSRMLWAQDAEKKRSLVLDELRIEGKDGTVVIKSGSITIVDKDDKPQLVLSGGDGPSVTMYGEDGKREFVLNCLVNQPWVTLYDGQDRPQFGLKLIEAAKLMDSHNESQKAKRAAEKAKAK